MNKTIAKVFTLTEDGNTKNESTVFPRLNLPQGRYGGLTAISTALTKMSVGYFFVKCIFDCHAENKKRGLEKMKCLSGALFYCLANKSMRRE